MVGLGLFAQLEALLQDAQQAATATVLRTLLQLELRRRAEALPPEPAALHCVICLDSIACPELACLSCSCESMYHYHCLSHASLRAEGERQLRCPTCRQLVLRHRVSLRLQELMRQRRRAWSDVALPVLGSLPPSELQVLKDGDESEQHSQLYALRVRVRRAAPRALALPSLPLLGAELSQLSPQQLQSLLGGTARRATTAAGLCCGLCHGPLQTFSDLYSQGCLRCSADTSLQIFYHRQCLEERLRDPSQLAPLCLSCGDGAVQAEPFSVKRRLADLSSDVASRLTVAEVLQRVRQTCEAVSTERAQLLRWHAAEPAGAPACAPAGGRSRSPPRRLTMLRGRA